MTGGWKRLNNEERNDLYCLLNVFSADQIEKNEMSGACSKNGVEERCVHDFDGEA